MGVTHGQRAAELILSAQRGDCFGRNLRIQAHFVEIISRGQRGKKKCEQGSSEEEEDGLECAGKEVAHQTGCSSCERIWDAVAAAIKRFVTGCFGVPATSSVGPVSTILP